MNSQLLKIGITCYPSVGGSGILASELGNELARRGHEVHFISYDVPFRLDVNLSNVYFHEVHINEYELFKYPDYTLPLSVKMADVSKKYNLDILHVHYAVPHAIAAEMAKQMLGTDTPKVITTLHGTDITLMGKDRSYQPIIKHAIESSCGVTAVSSHLKNETIALFDTKNHIEVIHNFYNPKTPSKNAEEIRKELGIKDDFFILHMSNLRPVKRISDLLHIVAESKHTKDIKLVILSGGNFQEYQPLVESLGIEEQVIVKERIIDIENYLNAADIGIYPSQDESFGLSILETMFYGHPVIASNAGGIPEVLIDKETGFIHNVGDIEGYVKNLDILIEDNNLRDKLGTNAKKHAEKNFSTTAIVNQYTQFYNHILQNCNH